MESTPTNTATTPAMPTAAASAAPLRSGSVRRLKTVTERIWESQFMSRTSVGYHPPQGVGDAQAHGLEGGQGAGHDARAPGQNAAPMTRSRPADRTPAASPATGLPRESQQPGHAQAGAGRRAGRSGRTPPARAASTRTLVKPIALSTPSSSVRSRTDWAMVLPATSRMVKNTALSTAITIAPMSPICWAKPAANAPSGFGFGFVGRVGEFCVDLCGDCRRPGRRPGDPDDVPADLSFAAGAGFIEIIVAEIQAGGVGRFFGAVEDADDFEFPRRLVGRLRPRSAN